MSELTEILDSIDIEYYLNSQGIDYKENRGASGRQLNLRDCPVCGNSKWKVYIGADTGLGNCFSGSCEQKFNKYSFIKHHLQSPSTSELIRHIKHAASQQGWRQKKAKRVEVVEGKIILPESLELPFNGKNLKYLTNRGVSSEMSNYFYLRYSEKGKYYYNDGERDRYQNYSERIIIPIHDLEGNLVTFQGRDVTGESERKYLFPPGFASTGRYLYNGHNAVMSTYIVMCEGVFDVISVKMALDEDIYLRGVTPVASFGKHLSNGFENDQMGELIKLKRLGLKHVCFMWDGEKSAIRAAIKAAISVLSLGIKASVAILPDNKDPNEVPDYIVRESYKNAIPINRMSAIKLLAKLTK